MMSGMRANRILLGVVAVAVLASCGRSRLVREPAGYGARISPDPYGLSG